MLSMGLQPGSSRRTGLSCDKTRSVVMQRPDKGHTVHGLLFWLSTNLFSFTL